MKKIMKTIIIAGALGVLSNAAMADVLDLKSMNKTGSYCPGSSVNIDLAAEGEYVERMLISAEGIRNDGFIKVFADGELIHNIGVPGYDPDYTFRVRRHVRNITLTFEETCSRILGGKIVTPAKAPETYHVYRPANTGSTWGTELLEMTRSLSYDLRFEADFMNNLWPNVLMPMKKIALVESASEAVRDERSLITAHRALKIVKVIQENEDFLNRLLFSGQFDYLIQDLLTMKEDILESYDVSERDVDIEIANLEKELDL
tara:strand:- start:15677 stop:16456 length:780 start_codon:yes stop_codon:yes gene_type:complete